MGKKKKVKYQKEFEEYISLFYEPDMDEEDKIIFKSEFIKESGLTPELFSLMLEKGEANGHTIEFQMKAMKQLYDYGILINDGVKTKDIYLKKLKELDEDDSKAWNMAVVQSLLESDNTIDMMHVIQILITNTIKTLDFDLYIYANTLSLTKKNKDKYSNRRALINKVDYLIKSGITLKDKTQEETSKIIEESK